MKKILHVVTGLEDGGAESSLFRLCTYDTNAKHIVVSLMGPGKYGALLMDAGVEVHCLSMPRGRFSFGAFQALRRIIRVHKPDVVQTWMYHAALVGGVAGITLRNKNIVWGIHHSELTKKSTSRGTLVIAKMLAVLSVWVPSRIVYCAQSARGVHESSGFTRSKGIVIPNGYDLKLFTPSLDRRRHHRDQLGIDDRELVFGNVARWHPDKDHETLISALGILKKQGLSFRAIFVGTGLSNSNKEFMQLIDQAGIRDESIFLGRRNDVNEIMTVFDFHVLSSKTEAFPNVIPEAMACGTLCISTDVGDVAEMISDTGWTARVGDPVDLSKKLAEAARSRGSTQDLNRRIAARDHVEKNYSIQQMKNCYDSLAW